MHAKKLVTREEILKSSHQITKHLLYMLLVATMRMLVLIVVVVPSVKKCLRGTLPIIPI
jgi:hypothetical protein